MAASARTLSGRRQIHSYIRILLQRPRQQASPTGVVTVPSVLSSDSGSTSSKRRKKSQESIDSCWTERNSEAVVVRDNVHGSHEQASHGRIRTKTAVANLTVCDADAMECGLCFLALRPPIFQCEVGHMLCSACRDKLEVTASGKCHVCGVATRGGYRRCHAMEHLLDCIRVPCPYAVQGCDATPPYHGVESHRQVCRHAPCRCPGKSCGFVGSTATLLDHFAGAHNWPCTTNARAGEAFSISLRVGFNFFLLGDHVRGDGDQAAATTGSVPCRLFQLNVTQERLGRAISVLCIHPHASAAAANGARCELVFSRNRAGSLCRSHHQLSVFKVLCTDLSNGLPDPEVCFQFLVPNSVLRDGDDRNSVQVKCCILN